MTKDQQERLAYLREDLDVWEDRRRCARWSLAADRLYNCSAMDRAIGEMVAEKKRLEEEELQPLRKRRPRET